jgi:hypothetical protein
MPSSSRIAGTCDSRPRPPTPSAKLKTPSRHLRGQGVEQRRAPAEALDLVAAAAEGLGHGVDRLLGVELLVAVDRVVGGEGLEGLRLYVSPMRMAVIVGRGVPCTRYREPTRRPGGAGGVEEENTNKRSCELGGSNVTSRRLQP